MQLGLDAPGALEQLARALQIIGATIDDMQRLPEDPTRLGRPGTEFHRCIHEGLPEPTVDPRLTVLTGLDISIQCLSQIKRFVEDPLPSTTPMVLAALMRSALLAGVRPIFMLGPLTPDERKINILRVMRQETDSLFRCYKRAATYTELADLVPPQDVLDAQGRRRQQILQLTDPLTETKMLTEAAQIVADRLNTGTTGDAVKDRVGQILVEHILWIFDAYSGKAHGYAWPRLVPHLGDLPGDFVSDFSLLASVAQIAVAVTEEAHLGSSSAPSARRTQP